MEHGQSARIAWVPRIVSQPVRAADLRRVSAQTGRNDALFEQKRAFLEARKRMLAAYRT